MSTGLTAQNYAVKTTPHQPFAIADFQNALFLAREPWMSPSNAFRRVENARAFRSQIVKRDGIDIFAELADGTSKTRVIKGAASGSGVNRYSTFTLSAANRPVPESIRFDDNSGVAAALIYATVTNRRATTIVGNAAWLWDVVAEGTSTSIGTAVYILEGASLGTWQANVYWHTHPSFSAQSADEGYVSYYKNTQSEIVGLYHFKTGTNEYVLACDPDYVYRYDLTDRYYKRQGFGATGFAGPFTGANSDYFWFWQVDDYIVMTNNVDPVCKWDPALATADSVLEMDTDWSTPGTNELDTALLVVEFGGYLVYLNTVENTTRYPTRARWPEAGSPSAWRSPLDYADAPRDLGAIVTARFIGERLFVGFESGWMELVRTGNTLNALAWAPHISRFGAVSKLSTIPDSERLLSRSKTSMQNVDPNGQTYLDVPIPDLVLDFSSKYAHLCAGVRSELDRSFWWTYASQAATKPDHVLCAVYDEENKLAWSQYALRMNVFSQFEQEGITTWDLMGVGAPLDALVGAPLDSYGSGSGGRLRMIGGQSDGMIYKLGFGTTDVYRTGAESIAMVIETQRLIPFKDQRAHFGWLDLYFELSDDAEIRLTFYADEDSSPYQTKTVTLSPRGSSSKAYKRVSVGRTASLHKWKLETLDDQPIAIDAFIPWFRPAGRARNF